MNAIVTKEDLSELSSDNPKVKYGQTDNSRPATRKRAFRLLRTFGADKR